MLVKAAPGLKVPQEEKPRDYITEDTTLDVPESAYYLRRISDGDLVAVLPDATKPKKGAA